jgi:hypothetical protein
MRGGGYGSNVIGFVIVIVVLYLLYALYNWLYKAQNNTSITQIGGFNMPMGTVMKDNQNIYLKKTAHSFSKDLRTPASTLHPCGST